MPALVDVARLELELTAQQSLTRSMQETERLGGAGCAVVARSISRSVAMTTSAYRVILA